MKKIIKLNLLFLLTLLVLSCTSNTQEVTKTPVPPVPYSHTDKAPVNPSLPLASPLALEFPVASPSPRPTPQASPSLRERPSRRGRALPRSPRSRLPRRSSTPKEPPRGSLTFFVISCHFPSGVLGQFKNARMNHSFVQSYSISLWLNSARCVIYQVGYSVAFPDF